MVDGLCRLGSGIRVGFCACSCPSPADRVRFLWHYIASTIRLDLIDNLQAISEPELVALRKTL